MNPPRQAMTMVANQAVNFADIFDTAFRGGLAGPVPHTIQLTRPSGPSTAGGKQILQHIRLVPARGPSTVMGSVNGVEARVQLRSYNYLAENHRRRFKGATIPIDPHAYTNLVKAIEGFFTVQRFSTTIVDQVPEDTDDDDDGAPKQSTSVALTAMLIVGMIVAAVVLVGLLVLMRR